jgi:gamma-glutamyltranspeptidase / glutathione hydrolase
MLLGRLLIVVAIAVVLFDPQIALALEKEPTAVGSGGAAATVDLAGTQAAIETLREGGNAIDAAVAAAGVLGA